MNCGKKFVEVADSQIQGKRDERGASLVEYALLVSLIAVVAIVAMQALGGGIGSKFSSINNTLTTTN